MKFDTILGQPDAPVRVGSSTVILVPAAKAHALPGLAPTGAQVVRRAARGNPLTRCRAIGLYSEPMRTFSSNGAR